MTTNPYTLTEAITAAFRYCDEHGVEVPLDLHLRARRIGALKSVADLGQIGINYRSRIEQALTGYLQSGNSVARYRNEMKRAAVEALGAAFDLGYKTAGGALPLPADALEWLNTNIQLQLGFIDGLFQQAREVRKEEGFEPLDWLSGRASGYTSAAQAFYNAGAMYAKKNLMLTWQLGNTEKHCKDCAKLNGKSHRASWFLNRNFIPKQPGASLQCGGYNCDCRLTDKDGREVTI